MEKETFGGKIYPEEFARPFTPLKTEIKEGLLVLEPRLGRSPRIASLKLTDRCQKNCNYCTAHEINDPEMTTKEAFRVIGNLALSRTQMLDLTGGEPTLRNDLPDIIKHARDSGIKIVTLSTNGGINKDYPYWYNLAENGLFGATFSYDGIGEKAEKKNIHLAAFLVNTLHLYGGIRMVVWKENLDKVFEIGENCMRNNIFFQAVPAETLNGETSESADDFNPLDAEDKKRYAEIISKLTKVRGPFAKYLRIQEDYINEAVNSSQKWHCRHPSNHWISVDAQGKARVCVGRALTKKYSLTGEDNPIKTKEFHKDIEEEAKKCGGCSWYCNWEGNRGGIRRVIEQTQFIATVAAVT